jgi:ribosomal protein L31E
VAEGLKTSAGEVVKIDTELHQMLSSRGLKKVQERCHWIHRCSE